MDNTTSIKNILTVFLIVLLVYLMSLLSALLIPLAMALLFALLFHPLQLLLIKWRIPKFLTIPIILILSLVIFNFLITSVVLTISEMAKDKEYFISQLNIKFEQIIIWLDGFTQGRTNVDEMLKALGEYMNFANLTNIFSAIVGRIGNFSGSFIIFLIYYILLLSGMYDYKKYLNYVSGKKVNNKIVKNFENIQRQLVFYIKFKSMLNLVSTVIFTSILYGFGIRFALFWGILNFFLNFIPNFGSLFSIIFVSLMGLIQFDSFNTLLFMIIALLMGNFIIGSLIEPKVMGDKLSLNTVTVIFGLLFWGYIWGVSGMFLAVPLLVITKVIFESFPALAPIGRVMGSPEEQSD